MPTTTNQREARPIVLDNEHRPGHFTHVHHVGSKAGVVLDFHAGPTNAKIVLANTPAVRALLMQVLAEAADPADEGEPTEAIVIQVRHNATSQRTLIVGTELPS